MKSLFRTLTIFLNTYAVLNKIYEIRLTPPGSLRKSFIKFRFFLGDGFPTRGFFWGSCLAYYATCVEHSPFLVIFLKSIVSLLPHLRFKCAPADDAIGEWSGCIRNAPIQFAKSTPPFFFLRVAKAHNKIELTWMLNEYAYNLSVRQWLVVQMHQLNSIQQIRLFILQSKSKSDCKINSVISAGFPDEVSVACDRWGRG